MAPGCLYEEYSLNSECGNDSGSDSEGGESSRSGSRSSSPESPNNQTRRSSRGSEHSRSPSPANSRASGSSRSVAGSDGRRSRRDSASSGSPQRASGRNGLSGSESPVRGSGNNPSPGDHKSDSGSAARASDDARSRSESPADDKSNVSERNSDRSRSQSPEINKTRKSRSRSVGSNTSRQSSVASRSGSDGSDNESGQSKGKFKSLDDGDKSNDDEGRNSGPGEKPGALKTSRTQSLSDSENTAAEKIPHRSPSPTKSASNSPERGYSKKEASNAADSKDDTTSLQATRRSRSRTPGSDSGSDEGRQKDTSRKRKRAILSDDSGSEGEQKKLDTGADKDDGDESEKDLVIDAEALFGDASDISSDEEGKKRRGAQKLSENEAENSHGEESDGSSMKAKSGDEENQIEMEEKDDEDKENVPEEPQPETRIDVQIPKITTDLGKDINFVKLPNFLSVETRPFDPLTYEDEIDEEETLDEEGRARLKLKVENTIRWREVTKQNGEFEKQSNARFVKWSDGSLSLHLGSEIFDVCKQPLQGDHNHLFIRQGTGLQGQAVFRTKLTFRPHSTESFTHRKMTLSLADRSQKTARIKVLSLVGKDPEAHRGELIKKEEERLRASVRRESKQRRIREKGASRGLSAGYLEPDRYGDGDSDDEGISINAIKKQHKNKLINSKDDRSHIYSSDEEGSDIETRRARRLDKAKALKDSDSEGSGDEGAGNKSPEGSSSEED